LVYRFLPNVADQKQIGKPSVRAVDHVSDQGKRNQINDHACQLIRRNYPSNASRFNPIPAAEPVAKIRLFSPVTTGILARS
jgi:hypothetical protein